jgi:hypothetical protein
VGWISAILGVARDRRGEWEGWTGKALSQLLDALPSRKRGFASAVRAQFWYEWHRKGFFASVIFALPVALSAIVLPLGPALYLDRPAVALLIAGVPLLGLIMASCIGQGMAKFEYWTSPHGITLFLATRPISTGSLVMAKLKIAAVVTLLGYALIVLFAPLVISSLQWIPDLPPWSEFQRQYGDILGWFAHPLVVALILGATWQSLVAGLSIGLLGQRRKMLLANFTAMIIVTTTITGGLWIYRHPEWHPRVFPILSLVAVLLVGWKVVRAIRSFRSARTQGLFTCHQHLALGVIWDALALVVLAAAYRMYEARLLSGPVSLFAAGYLFPGSELPNCALRLANDRHR